MNRTFTLFIAVLLMVFADLAVARDDSQRDKERGRMRESRDEMGGDEQSERKGPRGRGPRGHGENSLIDRFINNPHIVKKLGLSEEQVTELKKFSQESKTRLQELSEAMREAGKQQAQQITAENVDENAVMKAVEEAGRIRTEMAKIHASQIIMLKKFLTPEQSEELKKIMGRHREGRGGDEGRGEGEDDGFRRPKNRESGEEDMQRRREEMKEKMMERRKERLRELEKDRKEEDDTEL